MEKIKKFIQVNLLFMGICLTVFVAYTYSTFSGYQIGDCQSVEKITEKSRSNSSSGTSVSRPFVHK
jgi:hypothetical protein